MLYHAYQAHADLMLPLRLAARGTAGLFGHLRAMDLDPHGVQRQWAAACEVFAHTALTHRRPSFGIERVRVGDREVEVIEEVAHSTPFGDLLRFRKDLPGEQPRVLIAAPMSGHFATLLRDTVRVMLADHEVYITDWANARDVPLYAGRFGLDEYIEHIIRFLEAMGPGSHLVGVCQPCPAALAAAAIMAEDDNPARPRSITLMAGPVDCRISPTRVNQLANERPIEWFERNLISTVPLRHPGALRRVYPGFLQLTAFMSMNPDRHMNAFLGMYNCLVAGEHEQAKATQTFYEEYFAVADLPAEFYLETVRLVFQECALARGVLDWRGRRVDPGAIRRTALLTVEGEKDDICAIGQTMAAQELCTGIRPYLKQHHVQTGVGHYGVFSGRRWANQIYPLVRDAIHVAG
ncbi:MAG TPA: polyhydroxyalkanoate depolymerase [Quisquiliibacterium sp.]|nr:polyhydroxyalkanoate depolymerase [Quisquiliibacterium sp.]